MNKEEPRANSMAQALAPIAVVVAEGQTVSVAPRRHGLRCTRRYS
jgi:hypothetical protein